MKISLFIFVVISASVQNGHGFIRPSLELLRESLESALKARLDRESTGQHTQVQNNSVSSRKFKIGFCKRSLHRKISYFTARWNGYRQTKQQNLANNFTNFLDFKVKINCRAENPLLTT